MEEMKTMDKKWVDTPDKKLHTALHVLQKIITAYQAVDCTLTIDEKDYSGRYLLVEVMNIKSVGPNLFLSPQSDPGDGLFEVVVLPAEDKEKFAAYVQAKTEGSETVYDFTTIKGKEIKIKWDGTHVHADDEVINPGKNADIEIQIKPGLLQFLV